MESILQEIREKIKDVELVLVGLGEGFQYGWGALVQDDRYREIERETMLDMEREVEGFVSPEAMADIEEELRNQDEEY